MIDALIQGKIYGNPTERTASNGNPFVTAKVRTATGDEAIFVNVIVFKAGAVKTLLALTDGDSVALTGELAPKVYQPPEGDPRPSLDMVAHAALTPYHVKRKRTAVEPDNDSPTF